MYERSRPLSLLRALLVVLGIAFLLAADEAADENAPSPVDPKWLDRLDRLDRILLDELIGYAPPDFTSDLKWFSSEPMTWKGLRGKVVVLQSWTHRTSSGRRLPATAKKLADEFKDQDLQIILLHTPDGADQLEPFLRQRPIECPVALDSKGAFCDALGVYKDPANILIGRNGAVRYVGLNWRGTIEAVKVLLAEQADPNAKPAIRTEGEIVAGTKVEFPAIEGTITEATDVRGQAAPKLFVEKWISPPPDPAGKVVVIDFWNTSCERYLDLRPRINELADRFRGQVIFIGLSDEWSSAFDEGLLLENLDEKDFHYTLALDPRNRMKGALNLRTLPHRLVLSSDWIVRWQGRSEALTEATLDQIIQADGASRPAAPTRPNRWTNRP
jgi:thiol-disulfide isomerase/thioredoxin/peroxiredoxin